ncbi:MAG: hypothetical protein JWO40_202 [Candidatus Doudnabacteria bacterium]|nr:hypothetical protein [Candidatus Doudnabacteria bacterium]
MKKIILKLFIIGLVIAPAFSLYVVRADSGVICEAPGLPPNCDPFAHPITPTNTSAAANTPPTNTPSANSTTTNSAASTTTSSNCKFDQQSTKLCNPIPENNLNAVIVKVLKIILGLIGSVAVVVIVLAGFKMVYSQGNSEAIKSARESITWAIVGLVVALLAYTIVAIITSTLTTAK